MERTSLCAACAYYGLNPISLAVDPACRSKDEVDRLCAVHRARCTEGYCVLCGRSEPWVSPWPRSAIGCCRLCFRSVFGDAHADALGQAGPLGQPQELARTLDRGARERSRARE